MILQSPAKINIGLQIIRKRPDGFHELRSLMYPTGLSDIIEIREAGKGSKALVFSQTGIHVEEDSGQNLCEKAYKIFSGERELPPLEIHLHKQIPIGAGLGGGSSNATWILRGLNQLTSMPLPHERLHALAAILGSDCPFFLHDQAMMMEGRGETLTPLKVKLDGYWLVLLFPEIHISTPEAYAGVQAFLPEAHLDQLVSAPLNKWKSLVVNDFEKGIFEKYPELASIKKGLYKSGALYASLSGSGSSLYGIFKALPELPESISRYIIWKGKA